MPWRKLTSIDYLSEDQRTFQQVTKSLDKLNLAYVTIQGWFEALILQWNHL